MRAAELDQAAGNLTGLPLESPKSPFEKLALFHRERLQPAPLAGVEKCFTKELPICGVNQRVGGQDLGESRKRPSRSQEKTAALEFITLLPKARLRRAENLVGHISGRGANLRDEVASFVQRLLFGGVVRLPKFISKGFDQMRALTKNEQRQAFFDGDRNQSGPAGMNSKAKRRLLHIHSPLQSGYALQNNTMDAHRQKTAAALYLTSQ